MTPMRHGACPFCWTSQTAGVQEVPGSNSSGATKFLKDLQILPSLKTRCIITLGTAELSFAQGVRVPPAAPPGSPTAEIPASLGKAPTFHASFDHGPDADFVLGDKRLCNATFCLFQKEPADLKAGLGDPSLRIAEGRGKFDSA